MGFTFRLFSEILSSMLDADLRRFSMVVHKGSRIPLRFFGDGNGHAINSKTISDVSGRMQPYRLGFQ